MVKNSNRLYDKNGFTLIEIVVVMVIITILTAIVIPNTNSYKDLAKDKDIAANMKLFYEGSQIVNKSEKGLKLKRDGVAGYEFIKKVGDYANISQDELSKYQVYKIGQSINVEYNSTEREEPYIYAPDVDNTLDKPQINIHSLFVTDGNGSGDYAVGKLVYIAANVEEGYVFDKWSTNGVPVDNVNNKVTTLIMPDRNVSAIASFREQYLAIDADFTGNADGSFKYIGTETEVRIPHTVNGVRITSYHKMFEGSSVTKVISDNPNITDMSNMFASSKSRELDLSEFDTSNVTNMTRMFASNSQRSLDLSGFDTSKLKDKNSMFLFSATTSALTRTQEDANRLNSSSWKPFWLRFTVK